MKFFLWKHLLKSSSTFFHPKRRTEELINGVYGRYIDERQIYNSSSTVNSHISFPSDPSAPPPCTPPVAPPSSQQLSYQQSSDDDNQSIKKRLEHYLRKSSDAEPIPAIYNNDLESQVDSGHPSLDQSGSPSNNTGASTSNPDSPSKHQRKFSEDSLKANPFVVNGIKRPPNKIILDPIDHLVHRNEKATVPRHLFAVKKVPQWMHSSAQGI